MFTKPISKERNSPFQKGFSLLEIIITTTVMSIMFGLIVFSLLRTQSRTSAQSNLDKLNSDIVAQQIKAMTGATEGRTTTDDYGIYFLSDQYVLFHGSTYNPSEPTNFTVNLPQDLEIQSTTLPGNTLIFSKLSGEIVGFSESANTITIRLINTNEQRTVTLNRYGVITSTD
ncbi:MAG: type II secretion system protein [Candidatus Levybacteria bacterium]|nr:type II secretion system protein [Candidatus Levybacteria bacterium]